MFSSQQIALQNFDAESREHGAWTPGNTLEPLETHCRGLPKYDGGTLQTHEGVSSPSITAGILQTRCEYTPDALRVHPRDAANISKNAPGNFESFSGYQYKGGILQINTQRSKKSTFLNPTRKILRYRQHPMLVLTFEKRQRGVSSFLLSTADHTFNLKSCKKTDFLMVSEPRRLCAVWKRHSVPRHQQVVNLHPDFIHG